jgi:hypothetical protein
MNINGIGGWRAMPELSQGINDKVRISMLEGKMMAKCSFAYVGQ